jgi:hypothetical protein
MARELVVMSARESRVKAGQILALTSRQVARLCAAYQRDGAAGLVSRKRGRVGNRKLASETETRVVELVRRYYDDFGPTLAREKLLERHGIKLAKETVRKVLMRAGIWLSKEERLRRPHQPRVRRDCLGELVQIDGCEHHWFEDRGSYCSLLVFVDDATGRLMEMRFVRAECTFGYFAATASYIRRHGKPVAFYSDKHSVFRPVRPAAGRTEPSLSQFGRALTELNIDIICANTPQAKGRVERMNKTLQDRLVKELRLRGASDMEAGNAFLPEFMTDFNAKFGRAPRNPHDAHRPIRPGDDLDRIFSERTERSLSAQLMVRDDNHVYKVEVTRETKRLVGKPHRVTLFKWADGRLTIEHKGKVLPYSLWERDTAISPAEIVERKRIDEVMEQIQAAQRRAEVTGLSTARRELLELAASPALPAPPPRRPPPATIREVAPLGLELKPGAVVYAVRWIRQRPFLYQRVALDETTMAGATVYEDTFAGPITKTAARAWEQAGDASRAPVLIDGRRAPPLRSKPAAKAGAPAAKTAPDSVGIPLSIPLRRRERGKATSPAGSSKRSTIVPPPLPPDRAERLTTALWFTDTFHTAETERIRQWNEAVARVQAVEDSLRQQSSLRAEPPARDPDGRRRATRSG